MLVQELKCQQCHGSFLSGNAAGVQDPISRNIEFPPNLTPNQATGLGCWTDAQVVNAILNNVDNQGQPICQPMPNFADAGMTQEDAFSVVQYLRTLTIFVNNVPSGPSCCLFNLDCGDNAVCDQRECVDAGAPSTTGTAGTAGTTTSTSGTTGSSGGFTTGSHGSHGSSTSGASTATAAATSSSGASTTTTTSSSTGSTAGGTTGDTTGAASDTTGSTSGLTTGATSGTTVGTTGGTTGSSSTTG